MAIDIDDGQTEILIQKMTELTGETPEEAVRTAVAERHERLLGTGSGRSRRHDLNEIALRCARLPVISQMSDDEILGYDEDGVPTR